MREYDGFKTSFRGFAREDVLAYIDDLRAEQQAEQELQRQQVATLTRELEAAQRQLADAPQAAQREEALRAELATAQEAVRSLTEQLAAQAQELAQAQAVIAAGREQELSDELAQVRGELQAVREREAEQSTQLAQTHQAVAALWEEKEAFTHKLAAAAAFADRVQAETADLKRELDGGAAADTKPADKPLERWLF